MEDLSAGLRHSIKQSPVKSRSTALRSHKGVEEAEEDERGSMIATPGTTMHGFGGQGVTETGDVVDGVDDDDERDAVEVDGEGSMLMEGNESVSEES